MKSLTTSKLFPLKASLSIGSISRLSVSDSHSGQFIPNHGDFFSLKFTAMDRAIYDVLTRQKTILELPIGNSRDLETQTLFILHG